MRFLAQGLALDTMTIAIPAVALVYRARVTMPRPPVGVFTRSNIVTMIALLALLPYAYLHLPVTVVIVLFGASLLGMVHLTLAPVLGTARRCWPLSPCAERRSAPARSAGTPASWSPMT